MFYQVLGPFSIWLLPSVTNRLIVYTLSTDCGGELGGEKGTFASPNWPRNYHHRLNCTWTITVPEFKVRLGFFKKGEKISYVQYITIVF